LLDTICDALNVQRSKICVFVDRVDEYAGEVGELMPPLRLQSRTTIKLCLVSCPQWILQRILADCPSMEMELHNSVAVEDYAKSASGRLDDSEKIRSKCVFGEIVARADRVMLWTHFAVDEFIEKYWADAKTAELQALSETLPEDLAAAYEHIFTKMSEAQKREAKNCVLYPRRRTTQSYQRTLQ